MVIWFMKTTVEIPDHLFRKAKSEAALRGVKLKDVIISGLKKELQEISPGDSEEGDKTQIWLKNLNQLGRKIKKHSKTKKTLVEILLEDRR